MFFWKRFTTKHFPKALIPRCSYKHEMNVESLFDGIPGFLVARRLDGSSSASTNHNNGKFFFRLDSLGEIKHLSKMSLDLLGGLFSPNRHQRYRTKGKGSEYWDGKTVYRKVPTDLFYYYEKECSSVAIEASRIKSVPVPYRKELNKAQHDDLVKKGIHIERFIGKKAYDLEGEFRLEHAPTVLNYWHFQVNFYPAGETRPMDGENKGWRGDALKFLVQFLLVLPVCPVTMCAVPAVPSRFYKK